MASDSSESGLTIGLLPYKLEANAYIDKNRQILERIGNVVPVPPPKPLLVQAMKQFIKSGRFRLYDVLIVNWRENTLTKGNNLHLAGILEYFCSLFLHRSVTGKLIYVKHNNHPHNLPMEHIKRAKKLVNFGLRFANTTVVHSPIQLNDIRKTLYVPHPLYDILPKDLSIQETGSSEKSFVMIGRVQPYKKIDEVISYWTGPSKLVILGPCTDRNYLRKLKELSKNKNVEFEIDFHPESYLTQRARNSTGVIITNDNSSMLVSGSFFYAISCGTPVYVKNSSFFEWLKQTNLSKYIFIEDTVELLVTTVANNRSHVIPRKDLLNEAEFLFGDLVTEAHWRKAIFKLVCLNKSSSNNL